MLTAIAAVTLLVYLPTQSASALEMPFLEGVDKPVVAAFAGFPGCGTVCPANLALLSQARATIDDDALGLLFINVARGIPDATVGAYAQAIDPHFDSFSIDDDNAAAVYRALALDGVDEARAIQHTAYIYVFAQQGNHWRIERVYRRQPSLERLREDLRSLVARI